MDGATRNLLLKMSRNGGSLFAGVDATAEADPVVDRAIAGGLIALRADSWATGDFYVLTVEGWRAIGSRPPQHTVAAMTSSERLQLTLQICGALAMLGLAAQLLS